MHQGKYAPVDPEVKQIRFLDYISLFSKPIPDREELSVIYKKMRDITKERNITIFTPRAIDRNDRITQDGYTVDTRMIDFALNRAVTRSGKMKFVTLKNRG